MTECYTLEHALAVARARLADSSPSAALDAEVLLLDLIDKPRSWLYGFGDTPLTAATAAAFFARVERRCQGEPVAYLVGRREFYGLTLKVSPATLIPRPDTELLVDTALALATSAHGKALDLGTGSGAIALAFASQRPNWQVTGTDRVAEALALARENAQWLGLGNTHWLVSHWFESGELSDQRFELILSNPPYIDAGDDHLSAGDVRFEPASALVADDDGMADLKAIAGAAPNWLERAGWLVLEHGYKQASQVRQYLEAVGYSRVRSVRDLSGHERVTLGQWTGAFLCHQVDVAQGLPHEESS